MSDPGLTEVGISGRSGDTYNDCAVYNLLLWSGLAGRFARRQIWSEWGEPDLVCQASQPKGTAVYVRSALAGAADNLCVCK